MRARSRPMKTARAKAHNFVTAGNGIVAKEERQNIS
jgi:hypothetical protein